MTLTGFLSWNQRSGMCHSVSSACLAHTSLGLSPRAAKQNPPKVDTMVHFCKSQLLRRLSQEDGKFAINLADLGPVSKYKGLELQLSAEVL